MNNPNPNPLIDEHPNETVENCCEVLETLIEQTHTRDPSLAWIYRNIVWALRFHLPQE